MVSYNAKQIVIQCKAKENEEEIRSLIGNLGLGL